MTIRKNVSGQFIYVVLVNATNGTAVTGATLNAFRSIDGGAQASCTGTATELANGQYKFALSQADTNGNNIGYLFTATSAVPVGYSVYTTAGDPTDGVRLGLTALPNANPAASGGLPTVDANNRVKVLSGIDKNAAFSNFIFFMTDSTNHLPLTGKVNADFAKLISIDGGATASIVGSITEVDHGFYKVSLLAAETNGNNIALSFKTSDSDYTVITIVTSQ